MLTKEQKKKVARELTLDLQEARSAVFSSFQGLKTSAIQQLRLLLRKENIKHQVVKLTLLKRALRQAGINSEGFDVNLPLAISVSRQDDVAAARILNAFARTHEHLKIVAGVLDKKLLDAAEIKKLALLPSKPELLGQVVGVIASPLRGLLNVLSGNLRGLLNVLSAIKEVKS